MTMFTPQIAKDVLSRIVALFITSSLGIITGSAVINATTDVQTPIWVAAALAGFASVSDVVSKLAKASLDGKLEMSEVDEVFGIARPKKDA
jgi:hypothetical protein